MTSIPWQHRLTTKLLTATAALALVGAAIFGVTESRFQDALIEQMANGAELFSETIERATSKAMLENHREEAYETMRAIGAQPGIEKVRMFNKRGVTTFSTLAAETGQVARKDGAACVACHASAAPVAHLAASWRTRIVQTPDGHRSMGVMRPLYNQPRCSTAACHAHAGQGQVLGVLDVEISLQDVDARIGTFQAWSLLLTAVFVALLSGSFYLVARANVVRPVAALVQGARRVAGGERAVQIQVGTSGELGLLAGAFNEMIRALGRAEDSLTDLNRELERKVDARTAELQSAQAKLVQAEKLRSLGQLSASIAHEINNPLAGILTFAKLLLRGAEQDVPDPARRAAVVRSLGMVERETERCSAIVRSLLDFARERPLTLVELDLNAVIAESLQLIEHQIQLLGEKLVQRLLPAPPVRGDYGQLRQAIVNVALNACEAMGRGGTLTIESGPSPDGARAQVVISDTGPGIPAEELDRIFDPFFTTKAKGTGLGLSVVYGILQRHGGSIDVQSVLGAGTTFTFTLPASGPATLPAPGPASQPALGT